MQKKPLVSILIASYNKEKYVKRCINSCLNQSYNKLEVIFYDDGSKDNSFSIAKKTEGIKAFKNNKKIIGVGETGLDFYYNNSDKIDQIKSFEEHILASSKLNIPLIIHSRNAEDETLKILNKYKDLNLKILMHCFTGSKEFAKKLMDLNAYFSASGIITFKNSIELQETFKFIDNDKILIETDSPFLAPTPMRGKKNEPSYIKYTLEKLSEIKSLSFNDLEQITNRNFNNLFS